MDNFSLTVRDTNLKKGDASPMKQMKKAIERMNTINSCIYLRDLSQLAHLLHEFEFCTFFSSLNVYFELILIEKDV